jgi:hypothetical protein
MTAGEKIETQAGEIYHLRIVKRAMLKPDWGLWRILAHSPGGKNLRSLLLKNYAQWRNFAYFSWDQC